jgi:hypothetical protein
MSEMFGPELRCVRCDRDEAVRERDRLERIIGTGVLEEMTELYAAGLSATAEIGILKQERDAAIRDRDWSVEEAAVAKVREWLREVIRPESGEDQVEWDKGYCAAADEILALLPTTESEETR